MRLTYLAHASLLVEAGDVRLVTDPWLDGPTYLSAWWHFPAPVVHGAELRATHVYLTHEHADHCHPPTLRALPRSTTMLVGKYATRRFRDRLEALGFSVRELPHGSPVRIGPLELTSYQYRADDTALTISDGRATILDLNDCLLRDRSLDEVLSRHTPIDLMLASFANAEAYPIVYSFEDPHEVPDWDDASRFDTFLAKVRAVDPVAFAPFASMFCFLEPSLRWLNDRIVSPAGLLARAGGEVRAAPLAMDPGDVWTPRGLERRSEVDWSRRGEIIEGYARTHAADIAALAARERIPGGRAALESAFEAFFRGFCARVPAALRGKLDLRVRFDVTGPEATTRWLSFDRGRLSLDAPASDDAWDVRIEVPAWPLWMTLTRQEWWQHLGISCRFRVTLRPGVRSREVWLWTMLYLDDLGYLSPLAIASPRALSVLLRRHREVWQYVRDAASGRFGSRQLQGKYGG